MNTKHTPGPWQFGIGTDFSSVVCGDVVIGHTFASEDARLIAAAPDLLAALAELVAELDNREAPQGSIYRDTGGMMLARAAIAKATGGKA